MPVTIAGRGTARPAQSMSQSQAAEIATRLSSGDERERRLVHAIFRRAGVEHRSSVLIGEGSTEAAAVADVMAFYPASQAAGPPVRERMDVYHAHALPLAASAARQAIDRAGAEPGAVAQVVAVSCTGLGSPGLDIGLIESLGLAPETGRTMIGFMGCHGVINGLRVAQGLALAEPGRPVLLCAVELCSLHYQYGEGAREAVPNALFGDGAAAAILRADGANPAAGEQALRAVGSCLLPDSGEDMTWRIGNHGFEMTLSPRVPELIEAHLGPWLRRWLGERGLTIEEIGSWAIHPGGPQVLDAVCAGLDLPAAVAEPSRRVLAEAGNMSSPTVLFILERLRSEGARRPTVLLAFGPGLVAEAALLD